ncbi:MAG TPA: flavin reductase family protein [Candidatus Hydrothermia bacterium]|nr:flavin reductase family protein [Candidatus Hydrothermae bacterium]MDD3649651.1 flavin reductase family protein [Candidatus Hydrothermia bacterium]MDD5572879.1 flavin reductase family protein [Candidatus Hydrothermia bacterium]HOK23561.1 flavin reductase family protein [Candidatus Hydrothermia bacterium]HOL24290.1 flavin reductase family protein [Candidatus Hydrothermia bacterium]
MQEVRKYPYRILHPSMVAIISTMDLSGTPNACTVAWSMPVSSNPPLVAIALQKKHKSTKNIEETKEFVINIPGKPMLEIAKICGSVSGWEVNKFQKYHLEEQPSKAIKTPRIAGSIGYMECTLFAKYDGGDHYIFVGEIKVAEADERYFKETWNENAELIFHYGGDKYGKVVKY